MASADAGGIIKLCCMLQSKNKIRLTPNFRTRGSHDAAVVFGIIVGDANKHVEAQVAIVTRYKKR